MRKILMPIFIGAIFSVSVATLAACDQVITFRIIGSRDPPQVCLLESEQIINGVEVCTYICAAQPQ